MKGSSKGKRTWMRHVLSRERRGQGFILTATAYQSNATSTGRKRKHKPSRVSRRFRGRQSTYTWRR